MSNSILSLFIVILVTYAQEAEEFSLDWWDILNADVTCCPLNMDEASCNAEAGAGSSCVWLPANDPIVEDNPANSQCVGKSYFNCKSKDIDACCTPACKQSSPNFPGGGNSGGAGKTPVNCGPAVTPVPTTPTPDCVLGDNYQFEGGSCKMSGDPHTTMFNGNRHDFQGTPTYNDNRGTRNQFYYIHPCAGESDNDMPLKVAGTHFHWGDRDVSGIDYLSITLTDSNGDIYQVYLSSQIAAYTTNANSGASSDYDIANGNNMVTSLTAGTTNIGTRFQVQYSQLGIGKASFKITIDGDKEFPIYMQGQSDANAGTPPRYRMHYVQMTVPQPLRCFTCGLCGDFVIKTTGATTEAMRGCDGSLVNYRAGWSTVYTPEAYDTFGWTWEKIFTDEQCIAANLPYNNQENTLKNVEDACDAAIQATVDTKCAAAIGNKQTCCDKIGNAFCDGLLNDCKVDACAGANGNVNAIDGQIQDIIIGPIEAVCNNDDLIDENPPPEPLDFSCEIKTGTPTSTVGSASSVSCDAGQVLTSCGILGSHLLEGTYINPASPNTCNAKTLSASWAVTAKAVCCKFTGVTASVTSITSTTMNGAKQVVTTCPVGSSLTGCQVDIISGGTVRSGGDLRGLYAGTNAGENKAPSSFGETGGISTGNQCVAESQVSEASTTIRGGAQCLSLSNGYELDCVATSAYVNMDGFDGDCPNDYKLVACMTYTRSNTLDSWYQKSTGCYVQQDNHANQYANGICCKLTQTATRTLFVMDNIRDEKTKQTYYFQTVGIVGLVLILCGGGLYWRKNKDGNKTLNGIDSEQSPLLKDNRV